MHNILFIVYFFIPLSLSLSEADANSSIGNTFFFSGMQIYVASSEVFTRRLQMKKVTLPFLHSTMTIYFQKIFILPRPNAFIVPFYIRHFHPRFSVSTHRKLQSFYHFPFLYSSSTKAFALHYPIVRQNFPPFKSCLELSKKVIAYMCC